LFNDIQLSGKAGRSCGSCHIPAMVFTDGKPKALATDGETLLLRNTPTLLNAGYQTRQFYDSRQPTLEFQINDVVHNPAEMMGALDETAGTIAAQQPYKALFDKAYPGEAMSVTRFTILNAIANYVRSLKSLNARFDRYMRGENVSFSAAEQHGFNLFMGKAKCGTCHFAPLFNGLVPTQFTETESEVLGVPETRKKKTRLDADSGRYYFTKSPVHLFAFKTPTVRNIALTAPYMHNGVFETLEEVIEFYNQGGGWGLGTGPVNQTLPAEKLNLTKQEKKDIIAFLHTLTDTSAVHQRY
jgi:cytochrome c peroxidase